MSESHRTDHDRRAIRNTAAACAALSCVAALNGCTGLEPAFLGVTLQAAERGVAIVDGVDVNTFEFAPYHEVVAASDRAAKVLALNEHSRREIGGDRLILHYQLRPLERMVIEIRKETENLTLVRTEVRSRVLQGVSAIYLRQLYHELTGADAYIEEWVGQSREPRTP